MIIEDAICELASGLCAIWGLGFIFIQYAGNEKSAINISTPKGIEFNSRVFDWLFKMVVKQGSMQIFLYRDFSVREEMLMVTRKRRRSNLNLDESMAGYMDFVLADLLSKQNKKIIGWSMDVCVVD